MANELRDGRWNPARVLAALGKIGYSPVSAVLDIVDNAVSAGATKISVEVLVASSDEKANEKKKAQISGFRIIDNGCGMTVDKLDDALALGSSDSDYSKATLSKFGLGLKSAGASLGRALTVVTRVDAAPAVTAVLDQDVIAAEDRYVYAVGEASPEELERLNEIAGEGAGTLVQIDKVDPNQMLSPTDVIDGLRSKAGVVYFRLLAPLGALSLQVNGEAIEPVDPLFESEASSDLDEYSWDGRSTCWIQHPQPIQLTADGSVTATVSMTQLPHPPALAASSGESKAAIRNKYLIQAGNYGFYVYRNGRLISWADSLDMVPQDQDLYAFRGRLEISTAADETLNLDVTKSRIQLSDIARAQLTPLLLEGRKKSAKAWKNATQRLANETAGSTHDTLNEELTKIGSLEEEEDKLDEAVVPQDERTRRESRRKDATSGRVASEEEQQRLHEQSQAVQFVDTLANNQLWERAHDPTKGLIVRVNRSHRLFREVLEPALDNASLVTFADVLLFGLARAEYSTIYKSDFDSKTVEAILDEFREKAGAELSEVVKRLGLGAGGQF